MLPSEVVNSWFLKPRVDSRGADIVQSDVANHLGVNSFRGFGFGFGSGLYVCLFEEALYVRVLAIWLDLGFVEVFDLGGLSLELLDLLQGVLNGLELRLDDLHFNFSIPTKSGKVLFDFLFVFFPNFVQLGKDVGLILFNLIVHRLLGVVGNEVSQLLIFQLSHLSIDYLGVVKGGLVRFFLFGGLDLSFPG